MSWYMSGLIAILGINVIFAYGIYVTAAAGQLNLGGAGFQAIGAYACALLSATYGISIFWTLVFSTLVGAAIGFLIAFPILRTRGVYMVLATFAFAEVVVGIILNSELFGGSIGLIVSDYIEWQSILLTTIGVIIFVFYLMSTPL